MSRSTLIKYLVVTETELMREKSGEAFKDRVLSQIQPFPSPLLKIKLSGIKFEECRSAGKSEAVV